MFFFLSFGLGIGFVVDFMFYIQKTKKKDPPINLCALKRNKISLALRFIFSSNQMEFGFPQNLLDIP